MFQYWNYGDVCTEPVDMLWLCLPWLPGNSSRESSVQWEGEQCEHSRLRKNQGRVKSNFPQRWADERCAVMLKWEKSVEYGWEHLFLYARRLASPPLPLIQLPSKKCRCHLVPCPLLLTSLQAVNPGGHMSLILPLLSAPLPPISSSGHFPGFSQVSSSFPLGSLACLN